MMHFENGWGGEGQRARALCCPFFSLRPFILLLPCSSSPSSRKERERERKMIGVVSPPPPPLLPPLSMCSSCPRAPSPPPPPSPVHASFFTLPPACCPGDDDKCHTPDTRRVGPALCGAPIHHKRGKARRRRGSLAAFPFPLFPSARARGRTGLVVLGEPTLQSARGPHPCTPLRSPWSPHTLTRSFFLPPGPAWRGFKKKKGAVVFAAAGAGARNLEWARASLCAAPRSFSTTTTRPPRPRRPGNKHFQMQLCPPLSCNSPLRA